MAQVIANEDHQAAHFAPEPQPWRHAGLPEALVSVLGSAVAGNPNPDDDRPLGPGGPRIHQQIAALSLLELGSLISDQAARQTIQKAATDVLRAPIAQNATAASA
jgi:hypothetical protein